LARIGQKRKIMIFTRHYQIPGLLARQTDLIATLPTRVARQQAEHHGLLIREPPFYIPPFELKMAWSPLLHHNPAHQWLRRLIVYTAKRMVDEENQL
jgi:DNA-binding transcriptional LysR family regulator